MSQTYLKKSDQYQHGDLRNAALQASLEIIKEDGIHKLSLREVARRIGVSAGAPHKHFSSKEALLATLAANGFELFERYLRAACPDGIHLITLDHFREMGRQYIRFAEENTEYFRLMFTSIIPDHRQYPELWAASQSAFSVLVQSIEVLQRDGVIKAGIARKIGIHIISTFHGFVFLQIERRINQSQPSDKSLVEQFEPHFDMLFAGIGT